MVCGIARKLLDVQILMHVIMTQMQIHQILLKIHFVFIQMDVLIQLHVIIMLLQKLMMDLVCFLMIVENAVA